MTTVNLTQQQYRDARKQFGRSMIVQLIIFMAIELGVEVIFYVMSLLQNLLIDLASRSLLSADSVITVGQFVSITTYVYNFFSFIILVGVLFLHRSVTFRSADSMMHNVLPLAGMLLLNRILFRIVSSILIQFIPFPELMYSDYVIVLYFVFSALYILITVAIDFARAGTIHFARRKGSEILLILPLMGFLLLAVVSPLVSPCSAYSYIGMVRKLYSALPSLLSNLIVFILEYLLPYLLTGLASFFAMRMLVYRDTYDTKPRVQQQYLQRYVQAYPQLFQQNVPSVPETPAYAEAPAPVQPVPEAAPVAPSLDARKEE